jgi:hypothetical protein
MKHYEWQKMVKAGVFHKLSNKWRMKCYEQQEMVKKSEILHKLQVTCDEEWNVMNSKKWSNPEYFSCIKKKFVRNTKKMCSLASNIAMPNPQCLFSNMYWESLVRRGLEWEFLKNKNKNWEP